MTTTMNASTRNGQTGITITCDCKTHEGHTNVAFLTGAVADALARQEGKELTERIHGYVTMANHPAKMMRVASERKGIFAA
jgi:hypothetical protein